METHRQNLAAAVHGPQGSINKWLYIHGVHSAGERTAIIAAALVVAAVLVLSVLSRSRSRT